MHQSLLRPVLFSRGGVGGLRGASPAVGRLAVTLLLLLLLLLRRVSETSIRRLALGGRKGPEIAVVGIVPVVVGEGEGGIVVVGEGEDGF